MEEQKRENRLQHWGKQLTAFMNRDTMGRNESKKLIVVIRWILLAVIVYCLLYGVFCDILFHSVGLVQYVFFSLVFVGIFGMTYYSKTLFVLWVFNISMILWVWSAVDSFGWNIGVQHFLMVLLVLYFFSSYQQYVGKIGYAAVLCAFRIWLYLIYNSRPGTLTLGADQESVLQILNTVTIFLCLSIVAFVFSKDTQELEGKLVEYNKQLIEQVNTDPLTGIYNRRRATEYMTELTALNRHGKNLFVCICDIDFFKQVNDTYGHSVGDRVLAGIAGTFRQELGNNDFAARWGGEEFVLIFQNSEEEVRQRLTGIQRRVRAMQITHDQQRVQVTLTFGVAKNRPEETVDQTLRRADQNLYVGKESGRDRIIYPS